MTDMAMLANRVRKNARHLGKWARREAVTCWRVYDRDIPEIPITVDTYEGALVINDYRAFERDDAWLDAAVAAVRAALGADEVFVKHRERFAHRGAEQQYERQSDRGARRTARAGRGRARRHDAQPVRLHRRVLGLRRGRRHADHHGRPVEHVPRVGRREPRAQPA